MFIAIIISRWRGILLQNFSSVYLAVFAANCDRLTFLYIQILIYNNIDYTLSVQIYFLATSEDTFTSTTESGSSVTSTERTDPTTTVTNQKKDIRNIQPSGM